MVTGDGAYIKKLNRSHILERIIEHGYISRAEIAKITGLNKATISVQVADLLEANLVTESQQEHTTVGRRPIMLSINGNAAYVLGIDLDYGEIKYRISDLQGNFIEAKKTSITTNDYKTVVRMIADEMKKYQEQFSHSHYGLVETIIGVHGTVNHDQRIRFIPRLDWKDKHLQADLEQATQMNISVANNANLLTFAERVHRYSESNNLIGISLRSGIGAGVINNGKLISGRDGYAGEIGHMIISPYGKACRCGNHGCWELYAAEPAVFSELQERLDRPKLTYQDIGQLLDDKHPICQEVMDKFINYIAIGINNLINSYNPETLIINSELLKIYPNAVAEIIEQLHSSVSVYGQIVLSDLAEDASVLGACALAIKNFLEIKQITYPKDKAIV